jgi:hypothetical protein
MSAWNKALLAACFMLVPYLAYSSNPKMETICSSETSVDFYRTTWHYIPEVRTPHSHRCENLKSYRIKIDKPFVGYVLLQCSFSSLGVEAPPPPMFILVYSIVRATDKNTHGVSHTNKE